jgi:putative transposase
MPRPLRLIVPGVPFHIIQRGNNRTTCFRCDDDRQYYKRALFHVSRNAGCAIHAYVLMTNHVHLLASAKEKGSTSRMMQSLGGRYVRYFNSRYGRTGTLWEGRFRSTEIDSERYFLLCSRYIETNPVRAQMVTHPSEFRWSSVHRNAHGQMDALVTPHEIYLALAREASSRQAVYRDLLASALGDDDLRSIRYAISTYAKTNTELRLDSLESETPLTEQISQPSRA